MPLRVSNLRLPVEEPEANLNTHVARALGVTPGDVGPWRIRRKALDTRDKRNLQFVYNFEVDAPAESVVHASGTAKVELAPDEPFAMPDPGAVPIRQRPVVIGSGPGGLACAYFLALHGLPR